MVYRLLNIPMSEEDFKNEKQYIDNAAKLNGYSQQFVNNIVAKHQRQRQTRQRTTLHPLNVRSRIISLPFYPKVTNKLSNILHKYNIQVVTRNNNTLRNELCNYKDKQMPLTTSGIYEVSCRDCDSKYRGQTRRAIQDRAKEHHSATLHRQDWKSSVAVHMLEEDHRIGRIKRLKYVREDSKLDSWESHYISRCPSPSMNKEPAPIQSYLYQLSSLQIR